MTSAVVYAPDAASIAAFLLDALGSRDELTLERSLGRARSSLSGLRPDSPGEEERVDLLVGIVERLDGRRRGRDAEDAHSAVAVCRPLLENLVAMPR